MLARALAVLVAALVLAPAASAASAPSGFHGFPLRTSENPAPRTFSRTPAFAWSRVEGATRYEFEPSTSRRFGDNALIWTSDVIHAPFATVPVTLPWISGSPYSWYARVRAWLGPGRVTTWSAPYGFNMKAAGTPTSLSSGVNPIPGLVRWTPVAGATAYQFNFVYAPGVGETRTWTSPTTAADLRELYAFHNQVALDGWAPIVLARSRHARRPGQDAEPAARGVLRRVELDVRHHRARPRHGQPDLARRHDLTIGIVERGLDERARSKPHSLMPAFYWSDALSNSGFGTGPCTDVTDPVQTTGVACPLFHVYIFSDEDCVNRVYTSDLFGSPAFVPRFDQPLDLPASLQELAEASGKILGNIKEKGEGLVYDATDGRVYAVGTGANVNKKKDRQVTVWDSAWPTGRWWWTVVPAVPQLNSEGKIEYRDVEIPQYACQAGDVQGFRKTSNAVIKSASGVPYASGQDSTGRVHTAGSGTPAFYSHVVVAWRHVPAAHAYQVRWSRHVAPWKTAVATTTPANAAQFQLATGVWYHRVRGVDPSIIGPKDGMTWSETQYVKILPRTFVVGRAPRPAIP